LSLQVLQCIHRSLCIFLYCIGSDWNFLLVQSIELRKCTTISSEATYILSEVWNLDSAAFRSFRACRPLAPLFRLAFFWARNNSFSILSWRIWRIAMTGCSGSSVSKLLDKTWT
jgi:hypothetical protein